MKSAGHRGWFVWLFSLALASCIAGALAIGHELWLNRKPQKNCAGIWETISAASTAFYGRSDKPSDIEAWQAVLSKIPGITRRATQMPTEGSCYEAALIKTGSSAYQWVDGVRQANGTTVILRDGKVLRSGQEAFKRNDVMTAGETSRLPAVASAKVGLAPSTETRRLRYGESILLYIAPQLLLQSLTGSTLSTLSPADRIAVALLKSLPALNLRWTQHSARVEWKRTPNALKPSSPLLIPKTLACGEPDFSLHVGSPASLIEMLSDTLQQHDPALLTGIKGILQHLLEQQFGTDDQALPQNILSLLAENISTEILGAAGRHSFLLSGSLKNKDSLTTLLRAFIAAHPHVQVRNHRFRENSRTDVLIESGSLVREQLRGWDLKSTSAGAGEPSLSIATNGPTFLLATSGSLLKQLLEATCARLAKTPQEPIDPSLVSKGTFAVSETTGMLQSMFPFLFSQSDRSILPWGWLGKIQSLAWTSRVRGKTTILTVEWR